MEANDKDTMGLPSICSRAVLVLLLDNGIISPEVFAAAARDLEAKEQSRVNINIEFGRRLMNR